MSNTVIIVCAIIYIIWCGLNYLVAEAKNLQAVSVLVASIFFTPLIGYMYVLAMPVNKD